MSTYRYMTVDALPDTPKGICRWCQKPVKPPRTRWCSNACVEEYQIRANGNIARSRVHERDRGVCAACGLDTDTIQEELHQLRRDSWEQYQSRWKELVTQGFDRGKTLWQADHIVPVCEGGGTCGLENLRTLCLPCHKAETRALAQKRKMRRLKVGPQLELFSSDSK